MLILNETANHTHPEKSREPTVAILMGTRNGGRYLREQLESIALQTHENWVLIVSDDGSTDNTRDIVAEFADRYGLDRVKLRFGPCEGFVRNFLSMAANPSVSTDYYAFADQDDVWQEDKLQRAIDMIEGLGKTDAMPLLYCGRTRLVSESLGYLGVSRLSRQVPCFANALVQSIAGANTMLFNEAARLLVGAAALSPRAPASHDWWSYLAVTGAGGCVLYDPFPTIDYRQHGANVQGHNIGLTARARRFRELCQGRLRSWNEAHLQSLELLGDTLTEPSRELMRAFAEMHASNGVRAWYRLRRSDIRRDGFADNIALQLAALAGRL